MRTLLHSLLFAATLPGATIIQVDGPPPTRQAGFAVGVNNSQTIATSWTQTGNYTNVAISAVLGFGTGNSTVTAYLTTALGTGTALAQEIAHTVSFVPTTNNTTGTLTPLFVLPTLGPGTYYLTLSGSAFTGWLLADHALGTVTTDSGATRNADYGAGSPGPYPPGTAFFLPGDFGGKLEYSVTGDPLTTVPEPGTNLLVGVGLLFLYRNWSTRCRSKSSRLPHA